MHQEELEQALRASEDCAVWVELLTAYFESHELFFGHGTDNAGDEAYWLVRAVQNWDEAAWRDSPDAALVPRILELAVARAARRKPMAYLLGEAWFAGLRFVVDERVLIPRSPLAELIEVCFAPWRRVEAGDRLLDVGTGSGCLGLAAAHHCPGLKVDATDVSCAALELAAANAAALGLEDRFSLIASDVYPSQQNAYEIIVSNPPYVPTARLAELPPEYGYEPELALDGGPSGLDVVARLLAEAPAHLAPEGILIVEVGEARDAFRAAYPRLAVTWLDFERGGEGVFLVSREQLVGLDTY